MATMAEIFANLNTGLGNLSSTPMGQFGTQLLAQSGPQAGNPGVGTRLGQAVAGMSEMQRVQALQQYRQQIAAQQQQAQAFQMQQAEAKAEQQRRQQAAFQDPSVQAQLGPMAKYLAQAGVDPSVVLKANSGDALQAHRQAQLQQDQSQFDARLAHPGAGGGGRQSSSPKLPTPRQVLEEPLENGMLQKHIFDPATNAYKPYGKPYRQYAPGKTGPMQELLGQVTPDDNADAGPAVPGLPGSNASMMQPARQGAELLMHGSGSNPMAKPATPKTQADYAALPPGTAYVDPASGRVAIKRGK